MSRLLAPNRDLSAAAKTHRYSITSSAWASRAVSADFWLATRSASIFIFLYLGSDVTSAPIQSGSANSWPASASSISANTMPFQKSFVDIDVPIVALMRYEVSNLIKDLTVTHCAQHFLGIRVGNGVLELSANPAAPSTFERYRCYIVCDTHPSFMAFVVRYQPITNPDTSDDGGFPALVSN